jgi:DNA processing protein
MLYTKKEYFVFSLLAAKYEIYSNYSKPLIRLYYLVKLFKTSLEKEVNLFDLNTKEVGEFIEETFDKNSNYYENKVQKTKEVLFNRSLFQELENQAKTEIKLCKENNINCVFYEEKKYPDRLKNIDLSPIMFFYKGYFPSDKELEKSFAVIGSREIDKTGMKVAYSFGKTLSENGFWNISGLAKGADTWGHIGSLRTENKTGAVLAHGLAEEVYPKENEKIADIIIKSNGFLMSELPPSIKTAPYYFVRRDRLQSGLTKGVLVVETGVKSGTLHTVNYALQQEKLVGVWKPKEENKYVKVNLMLLGMVEPTDSFKVKSKSKLKK